MPRHQLDFGVLTGKQTMNGSRVIMVLGLITLFLKCTMKNTYEDHKEEVVEAVNKFELLHTIQWGANEAELNPLYIKTNHFSEANLDVPGHTYASVLFRIDEAGSIHLLNTKKSNDKLDGNYITSFDAQGKWMADTKIPFSDHSEDEEVIDFAIDEVNNYYLIVRLQDKFRVLKLDHEGKLVWERLGTKKDSCSFESLEGDFNRIIYQNTSIYLTCETAYTSVGRFNAQSGNFVEAIQFTHGSNQVYHAVPNKLLRVVFLAEDNLKGIECYDPTSNEKHIYRAEEGLFGTLLFSFGANHSNCFAYEEPELIKVPFDRDTVYTQSVAGMYVKSNKEIVVFEDVSDGKIQISTNQVNGVARQLEFELPDEMDEPAQKLKLIKVDDDNTFYFMGEFGSVLIFSEESQSWEKSTLADLEFDIVPGLQPYQNWQVDGYGNVYISTASLQGFHVVRLNSFDE